MSSYVDEQIRKMWTSTQNYQEPKNDAVQTERQKWIKAIEDIKADIEQERDGLYEEKANDYLRGINEAHLTDLNIITKHTKELMK